LEFRGGLEAGTPLRLFGAGVFDLENGDLRPAGCCCGRGFLGGLGNRRGFTAALGLGRRGRGFTDQFGGHNAGDEKLGAVIVKIHCGAFLVGSGHDSQAVHFVLDGLTFLHYLHNVLLGHSQLKFLIRITLCADHPGAAGATHLEARDW
jgi:hypothetical protein